MDIEQIAHELSLEYSKLRLSENLKNLPMTDEKSEQVAEYAASIHGFIDLYKDAKPKAIQSLKQP
ncbi:hypothetical protein FACS1894217_11920 [Clostridia bacterium]|nr:hypothetical protein FACS1894217_11920 [Clostridia bacterium]